MKRNEINQELMLNDTKILSQDLSPFLEWMVPAIVGEEVYSID